MSEVRISPADGDSTARLQEALDQARNAPVKVVIEKGRYVCGGLRLWSDTHLHFCDGAEMAFIPDYAAYAGTSVDVVAENSDRAMIKAQDAERIIIDGKGRLVCDSAAFAVGMDPGMDVRTPAKFRPRVLVVERCKKVELREIAVVSSPMWTLHFVDCEDVEIAGVGVENDLNMPNTDGLVIDGCRNVSVTDCTIRTADDGIVLKTSSRADGGATGVCRNVRVADCRIESHSCALKIGTESFSDFEDIVFEDCRIVASNRGLGIFSRDGGAVTNVRFSRIEIECHETSRGFWGSGEGICVNVLDRRPHRRPAGTITNIIFENITGSMQGAINLIAEHKGGIANVVLRTLTLAQNQGPLGTALAYDLRPTPADLEPSRQGIGRQNSWRLDPDGRIIGSVDYPGGMPGVFAKNVTGLQLTDVSICRPDPLPSGFNPELIVKVDEPGNWFSPVQDGNNACKAGKDREIPIHKCLKTY